MAGATAAHESLAALVRPRHYLPYRLCALRETVQHSNKLNLQQLHQILVTTIADQRRLVPDGLKIDLLPGPPHFSELLLVGQDGVESLGNLVNVEEPH
jgi:hypothetical protein